MAVSVLYEGWVVAEGAESRAEGGDVFVPTDAPMPFGTRVVLRDGGNDRALYVTRVDETVSAGMLLSADPQPRGAAKVDKQGPKPTPAPIPTSVTAEAAAPTEAAPVEVTAENTKPDNKPDNKPDAGGRPESADDSKKRRGRSRKPTLT